MRTMLDKLVWLLYEHNGVGLLVLVAVCFLVALIATPR